MAENKSWIAEMHQIVDKKKGAVSAEDEQHIREMMKIPNDDISIEDVEFKRHRSYF
jgi:hypothetical protein